MVKDFRYKDNISTKGIYRKHPYVIHQALNLTEDPMLTTKEKLLFS